MYISRSLPALLLGCSVLITVNDAVAQANYRQSPDVQPYRYGQLMVQRGASSWHRNNAQHTPAQAPAQAMTPPASHAPASAPFGYATAPAPTQPNQPQAAAYAAPVAAAPTPAPKASFEPMLAPAAGSAPAQTPSATNPMMGAYYMPMPAAPATEPRLAPGDSLPPHTQAYAPPPASVSTPQLETRPLENTAAMQPPPATNAYQEPLRMQHMPNEQRYVSGTPHTGETHHGVTTRTKDGVIFQGPMNANDKGYEPSSLYVHFANGYRVDELDWNIHSSVRGITDPNVLSELEWKDLSIYQMTGGAEYTHRSGFAKGAHVEISGAYGWILSGDNQDSDYLENDRANEFSRSNNDAGDGNVTSFEAAIGWEFSPDLLGKYTHFGITPLVGYQRETQDLTMKDGNQTVTSPQVGLPLGPFPGLDSRYETVWDGPFAGFKVAAEWPEHCVALRVKYISADYEGEGYWNLRANLAQNPSFLHKADGDGIDLSANYNWRFYDGFELFLDAAYQSWSAEDGVDITFASSGAELVTGLNEVNWKSQSYMVGLAYRW